MPNTAETSPSRRLSNDADVSDDEEDDAVVADEGSAEVADEVEPNRNDIVIPRIDISSDLEDQ